MKNNNNNKIKIDFSLKRDITRLKTMTEKAEEK